MTAASVDPDDLVPINAADHAYIAAVREADRAQELADSAAERANLLWEATSWKADLDERFAEAAERRKTCSKSGCTNPATVAYTMPGGFVRYLWKCDEHRCQGTRADGDRCTAWATGASALCAVHQRQAAARG